MSEALCILCVCVCRVNVLTLKYQYMFLRWDLVVRLRLTGTHHTVWTDPSGSFLQCLSCAMLELQLPANIPSISVSFCFCQKQQLTVFSLRICIYFHMYKYSLGSVVGEINLES